MDAETVKATVESANVIMGWLEKAKEYLKPFKPEVKSMVVNYKNRRSEINLLIHVPDGIRRKAHSVEVPAYQNFTVQDMLDETFARVGGLWRYEDGKWKLDPAKLPKSETYLVMLRGVVPPETLNQLVRVQPAINRDQTDEIDRYWLDCMLRNVALLEKIWQELNIEEVDVGVKVGIERCFSTTIPKEFKQRLEATRRWVAAGRGKDRQEILLAWRRMRTINQGSKVSADDILQTIYKLTTGDAFGNFLAVDSPYRVGEIRREERFSGLFPARMAVEATAELGLKRPVAEGYLTFKKKDYTQEIKVSLDKLQA
ncbi:MAG: hypothetical protein ABSC50_03525 [Candidatus Bathyarchaeia archaeon]